MSDMMPPALVWWDESIRAKVRRGDRFGYWVTFEQGGMEWTSPLFRLTARGAARCARRGVAKLEKIAARTERRWTIRS